MVFSKFMQFCITLLTGLSLGIAAPLASSLPPCSSIDRPCACPDGTTFKNLTSFGVIGAPAIEVQEIMGSFFDISFQGGIVPSSTKGKNYVPGATRTFNFSGPSGYYEISERLTVWVTSPDGSFNQQYEQSPKPAVVQIPGGGSYYGEWTSIIGQQTVIANETAVVWKNWRCEIGETFPAAASHEGGITNTSAILESNGKLTGVNIASFTIFYEGA